MCLQNIYDRRSSSAYNSAHNDDSGFVAAKLKLFLPSVLMINNGEMPPTSQRTLSDLYLKISIPIQSVDGFWTCLIIDMYDKEIYFYDPREFTENAVQIMNTLEVYANKIFDFEPRLKCSRLESDLIRMPSLCSVEDSGVYVIAVIEYFMLQCPLYINPDDINLLRLSYCLQVLLASKLKQ